MELQGAHHDSHLRRRKETADLPSPARSQDSSLKLRCWKIILGFLLLGSLALKLIVIVVILTGGSQCNCPVVNEFILSGLQINRSVTQEQCIPPAQNQLYADVRLDQNTAYHELVVSPNEKSVKWSLTLQHMADNSSRFDLNPCVLGREGFTSGIHVWEVEVTAGQAWALGVARESVNRKGRFLSYPECTYWAIGSCSTKFFKFNVACLDIHKYPRIQVLLDYARGVVLFFDAGSEQLLEILPANFSGEKIYPIFCVGLRTDITLFPVQDKLLPFPWAAAFY